jgi:hypothetical protein
MNAVQREAARIGPRPAWAQGKRRSGRRRATPPVDLAESPRTPGRVSEERVTIDPELGLPIAP